MARPPFHTNSHKSTWPINLNTIFLVIPVTLQLNASAHDAWARGPHTVLPLTSTKRPPPPDTPVIIDPPQSSIAHVFPPPLPLKSFTSSPLSLLQPLPPSNTHTPLHPLALYFVPTHHQLTHAPLRHIIYSLCNLSKFSLFLQPPYLSSVPNN